MKKLDYTKRENTLVALVVLAVCFAPGCCTHPNTSAELHQTTLVFKHYRANTVPRPTLAPEEQTKITQEGAEIENALVKIEEIGK